MGTHKLGATMIRVLVTSCLVGSVLSKSCESLPNQNTNKTLDGKDRISSFFSPGHCLAVDAKMNAADLHGSANAKLYWADCKNVADDSRTPLTLTHKHGKSVQVVVAEFQHFSVKRKNKLQHDFSLIKLKDGYKKDRCISVSGFSDISKGVRLQLSRCDTKNAKMRFTGHAAGLWVYKNKKRSNWCLWPPMKTGDTAKVGACISGLLGGSKSAPVKVNGNWTTWTKSGTCSKVCGSGKQNFTRICSNPTPANGGNACQGLPSKSETCNPQPCAVHGNWTVWSKSGVCSKACGADGKQNYTRTCSNPTPAHGGTNCTGTAEKSESCNAGITCPVHGVWSAWSKSGFCSEGCSSYSDGKQNFTRSCSNPRPAHGGNNCTGVPIKATPCNTFSCKVERFVVGEALTNVTGFREMESVQDIKDNYAAFRYFYNKNNGFRISKDWQARNCCTALKNGQKLKFEDRIIFPTSYHSNVIVSLCNGAPYKMNTYMGLGVSIFPEEFKLSSAYACGAKLQRNQAIFMRVD